jgi:hypothetical protein
VVTSNRSFIWLPANVIVAEAGFPVKEEVPNPTDQIVAPDQSDTSDPSDAKKGRPIGRPSQLVSYIPLFQQTSIFDNPIISPALRFSVGV